MPDKFKSLRGQLLLDGGMLHGSFFHRTVILVCQHDEDGAFGLVLNKPANSKVEESMGRELPESLWEEPLLIGGPVQSEALSYLHTDQFILEANVIPGLHLGHSIKGLIELGESFSPTRKVRVFAGYSGWTGGQLEEEMKRKAWLTHPASLELVFERDPAQLWQQILRLKGWKYELLAQSPEDLSRN